MKQPWPSEPLLQEGPLHARCCPQDVPFQDSALAPKGSSTSWLDLPLTFGTFSSASSHQILSVFMGSSVCATPFHSAPPRASCLLIPSHWAWSHSDPPASSPVYNEDSPLCISPDGESPLGLQTLRSQVQPPSSQPNPGAPSMLHLLLNFPHDPSSPTSGNNRVTLDFTSFFLSPTSLAPLAHWISPEHSWNEHFLLYVSFALTSGSIPSRKYKECLIRLCVPNAVHIAGPQSMISVTEVEHRI